jgi:hypothetical protein
VLLELREREVAPDELVKYVMLPMLLLWSGLCCLYAALWFLLWPGLCGDSVA